VSDSPEGKMKSSNLIVKVNLKGSKTVEALVPKPKDSKVDNGNSTVSKIEKALMLKAPRKKSENPKDSEVDCGHSPVTKAEGK